MSTRVVTEGDLNEGQSNAIQAMVEFVKSDDRFFLLEGAAGTGKSTCIQFFCQQLPQLLDRPVKIALTAPTNKAAGVLRKLQRSVGGHSQVCTIYSLLGLRLRNDEPVRDVSSGGENKAEQFDIIVVDEGGMVSRTQADGTGRMKRGLMDYLEQAAIEFGCKFIIMADRYQWNPIGQGLSPVFSIPRGCRLTEVVRHDNQILKFCTSIREMIDANVRIGGYTSDYDENGGVYVMNSRSFNEKLRVGFTSEAYSEQPDSFRTIAWRNATVIGYNQSIRAAMYGDDIAERVPFVAGERVIACQPIQPVTKSDSDLEFYMTTDQEGEVISVKEVYHPVYRMLKTNCVTIEPDEGPTVTAYTIHKESERDYKLLADRLSDAAKARKQSWAEYWTLKEMIHDVRPCHALTSHRAQGSTFETVFVDVPDLMGNPNTWEAMRGLYVAASRPSRILVLKK